MCPLTHYVYRPTTCKVAVAILVCPGQKYSNSVQASMNILIFNGHSRDLGSAPMSYTSAASGGAASVMALQAHTEVIVSIATNAYEDALFRCRLVVLFPSRSLLHGGKPSFLLSSLQTSV